MKNIRYQQHLLQNWYIFTKMAVCNRHVLHQLYLRKIKLLCVPFTYFCGHTLFAYKKCLISCFRRNTDSWVL